MTTPGRHPPAKRRKLNADLPNADADTEHQLLRQRIRRPISPPPTGRRNTTVANDVLTPTWSFGDVPKEAAIPAAEDASAQLDVSTARDTPTATRTKYVPAPVQLTCIGDLAPHQNVDAVGLKDILGDPMIRECWNFNYLHDVDFVM